MPISLAHTNSLYIQFIGLEICGVFIEQWPKEVEKKSTTPKPMEVFERVPSVFSLSFFVHSFLLTSFPAQQQIGRGAYTKKKRF